MEPVLYLPGVPTYPGGIEAEHPETIDRKDTECLETPEKTEQLWGYDRILVPIEHARDHKQLQEKIATLHARPTCRN